MNKNSKRYIVVILALIVLYNIIVFSIPFPKKDIATFIICYIASMISLLVQPVVYYMVINNTSLKSKLYGWPLLKVGYVYVIVQLLVTLLFYLVGAFIKIPTWISLIVCLIIAVFAFIGILLTNIYKEEIEKIEINDSINKDFIMNLRSDSELLAKKTTIESIHSDLVSFTELVKYSDPVSNESLKSIEEKITNIYNEMKHFVEINNIDEAKEKLKEVSILMEERNERCKLTKVK